MTTLTFQNTALSVINQNNQIWLSASEIGKALGYKNNDRGVRFIYDRHSDEFTNNMTALIEMQTNGGMQKVRIFSLRGCHLIGMLSHTKVAKAFRKWVLDILDKEVGRPQQLSLPEPDYNLVSIQNSEETLAMVIKLYSYCLQAHEMQERLNKHHRGIAREIEQAIGGHYLHNFKYPLEQTLEKAKRYAQSNVERLAIVKAVNNLLN